MRETHDIKGPSPVFAIDGAAPGPVLVVTGHHSDLRRAAHSLRKLPSLGYLRGRLQLQSPDGALGDVEPDMVLRLPQSGRASRAPATGQLHWTILAHAARLGMISGRGVPAQHLRASSSC